MAAAAYALQYNWVKNSAGNWVSSGGAWDDSYYNYNCYAFGMQKTQNVPPRTPYFFAWQPGYFAGTGGFIYGGSIYTLALVVKDDLEWLGYTGVSVSSVEPTSLSANQTLMCIRSGPTDYHFMRKNFSDGYWYHKPGSTAPLKYKYHPASQNWISESSILWF